MIAAFNGKFDFPSGCTCTTTSSAMPESYGATETLEFTVQSLRLRYQHPASHSVASFLVNKDGPTTTNGCPRRSFQMKSGRWDVKHAAHCCGDGT